MADRADGPQCLAGFCAARISRAGRRIEFGPPLTARLARCLPHLGGGFTTIFIAHFCSKPTSVPGSCGRHRAEGGFKTVVLAECVIKPPFPAERVPNWSHSW